MYKGTVKELREDGTALVIVQTDVMKMLRQGVKECYVDMLDSRPLSDKQRRMCYALMNAIAEWSGSSAEDVKTAFKLEFWADKVETLADKIFSLANAPMSLVAEFQRFLIGFIISNGVPVKKPLIDYVDDIEHYTYMCLIHKKCAVCGRHGELHHLDAVGMGNDRTEVKHEGREAISLCREHHSEMHTSGREAFLEKYHLERGIAIDKTILKIYGLKH